MKHQKKELSTDGHPRPARVVFIFTGGAQVTRQVSQYGIKVSFWGSGTLKIVIYVENHPQKPKNWLAYYHPLCGGGC